MSLVPVVVLGGVLASTFHNEARRRGVAEARREATLVARTALEPLLDGHPLSEGLTASEQYDVSRVVSRGLADGNVLRVRLRGLDGRVVYSDDGSGFGGVVE